MKHVPSVACCCFPAVDLTSVLTPEVMAPILANPEVQQRLLPYLPSGESLPQSCEELSNTLNSPQFQQVKTLFHCCDTCAFYGGQEVQKYKTNAKKKNAISKPKRKFDQET